MARHVNRIEQRGCRLLVPLALVALAGVADAAPGRARAAIDGGTNSVTMVVANKKGKVVFTGKIGTALGEGRVAEDDPLGRAAQRRTYAGYKRLVAKAISLGVAREDISLVMTAAARDARRAPTRDERKRGMRTGVEFRDRVRKHLVPAARILEEDEEADYGFFGALLGVPRSADPDERFVVVDTGGGSHQVTVGTRDAVEFHGSRKVGSFVVKREVFAPLLPEGGHTLDGAGLAQADQAIARHLVELPRDRAGNPMAVSTDGATLVLTGGFAHFMRVHFQREEVTRAELVALRTELARRKLPARLRFIRRHHDGSALSDAELVELGLETHFTRSASPRGASLPAKATLILRLLDLLGRGQPDAVIRLSTTDVRHHLLDEASK